MKQILITGAGSYIGESVRAYLQDRPDRYEVRVKETIGWEPVPGDFRGVDVVFHAAGIAHIRETKQNRHLYYQVNRDLAVRTAKAAKAGGVKQFILLSSMSVYGITTGHILKDTPVHPVNAYGESKAQADAEIAALADDTFRFVCLRPPMVYGKGCKGNYRSLRTFALKSPVFPDFRNRRSMIYIGNLCAFVEQCIAEEKEGLFFPQNAEYTDTSEMVRLIAKEHGKAIRLTKLFNGILRMMPLNTVKKVFGDLTYEKTDVVDCYRFPESVKLTETADVKASPEKAQKPYKKKALLIASMASNLDNFNRGNARLLQAQGYEVTLASNFRSAEDTNSVRKTRAFVSEMKEAGFHVVQIDFFRSVRNLRGQIRSFRQVRKLLRDNTYDLIHCHSPICAAMTRICAKSAGKSGKTKVLYTAHGFHFYKGAPLKNWIVFYPAEKILSRDTDVLITINREDYLFARRHLRAKKTVHIPGAGIDTAYFTPAAADAENACPPERKAFCRAFGIPEDKTILLSVGELNRNKNHETVLRALRETDTSSFVYVIAGTGVLKDYLEKRVKELHLADCVRFTGFCEDVRALYRAADVFVFPSFREGLSVSLMEAMACGLPVACSNIRGNTDLVDARGGILFSPASVTEIRDAISRLCRNPDLKQLGAHNRAQAAAYDCALVSKKMSALYEACAQGVRKEPGKADHAV